MKILFVLLAAGLGLASAASYSHPVNRIESLREKLVRLGKYAEWVKAKKLYKARYSSKLTGSQVAYDWDDVRS